MALLPTLLLLLVSARAPLSAQGTVLRTLALLHTKSLGGLWHHKEHAGRMLKVETAVSQGLLP